ncbi:maleylpyruvate isomerase N-terminal domain-containing protein [Dyadobacter sp. NIV53]|uniref:maleylpyruvate isomerase N-terminal domain-containing protein n=1 Tax=Dyadobacter sp. NIV53 TaxID=2861765 RepID=UPI001C88A62D|nr:maleylpyruvate isomerase N-terminal domain-containing protein [Dyadobacter sp. NIV53]
MIETRHLFSVLDGKLIELLKSLETDDWNKHTVARLWTVKDVAAHLLDGNLRMLSFSRDQFHLTPDVKINSYSDLIGYLNQINAEWVKAARRLSPNVLTDLLESTGKAYTEHVQTLNPDDTAIFSVAWAGEKTSKNWFHIAREYTEKWHHQQQIRKAVNKPGIMIKELFFPFISTLLLGLPHIYLNVFALNGTTIQLDITSEIGGTWFLVKTENDWKISSQPASQISAAIEIEPDIAWQLFTKAIKPSEITDQIKITGDHNLASTALTLIAVMA